jgi:hypothetical protein
MLNEEDLVANRRGKWSVAGVPHRGWVCVDVEDLGQPSTECQMCESQTIRYIHHMQHRAYPKVLQVGCVCAGHMEGSVSASRAREASMRSRAAKRGRWLSRTWKVSAKGNPHIKSDGYHVTVYLRGQGWAFTLAPMDGSAPIHAHRNHLNIQAAKLAAFDSITRFLSRSEA